MRKGIRWHGISGKNRTSLSPEKIEGRPDGSTANRPLSAGIDRSGRKKDRAGSIIQVILVEPRQRYTGYEGYSWGGYSVTFEGLLGHKRHQIPLCLHRSKAI